MVVRNARPISKKEQTMTKTFHLTRSMRIGSTLLTALLRAGLPPGSLRKESGAS